MKTIGEMIAVMQAAKEGKEIEYCNRICGVWNDVTIMPVWDWLSNDYRIKPEPKRVPLGPEDVPPGSVLRRAGQGCWSAVVGSYTEGVLFPYMPLDGPYPRYLNTFDELFSGNYEISRDGGRTWHPCWKEEA